MKRFLILFLLGCGLALAQSPLELSLERLFVYEQEVDGETVEVFEPALALEPAGVIQESVTARNAADRPLRMITLVLPVPNDTFFLAESAEPLAVGEILVRPEFSYDGGQTYSLPPLTKTVTIVENGAEVEEEVEVGPEDYTHVRWVVPALESQASVTASFRAVVR